MKDDTLLNFAVNLEQHTERVLKKRVESNSMKEKNRKSLKSVGSPPGVMYGSCNALKGSVKNCRPSRPILLALNIPTYKLAKFLVSILKPLSTNEFTVADSFYFAEEIVDKQPEI